MQMDIRLAEAGQARDCLSCVRHSRLWQEYFESDAAAEDDLREMILNKQIHVALRQKECIGFMGVVNKGCFRKFSYLSLIAVKNGYRGQGVGTALLAHFEKIGFEKADRVFLLVSDFNKNAQSLYRKLGYRQVGTIPDLFKQGVSENVLVKYAT